MATYRPLHLLNCPARSGRVKVGRCTCPRWRFLPGAVPDEGEDEEAEQGEAPAAEVTSSA
jgi:hypothetical protein